MNVNTGDRHDAAPQSRANQVPVLVSLDQLRNLQVYALHGGDVVVDVTAYVTGPTSPTSEEGLYIQLLRPAPIWSPTFTPQDATASRQVAGTNAIATDAIGVTGIIELRADERAHATVHPADQTAPETSTVNARDGEHLYGHYTTALSPDGQLSVHSPFDASVSLALTGYYTASIPEPGEPDDYEPAVLAYDAQQRLIETQTATGDTTGYGYWADGTRAAQHRPDGSTTLYLGATEVTVGAGGAVETATRTYSHADVLVAVRTDTGGLEWLFGNHQGSVTTTVTNGAAETRWYTPYGNQRGPDPLNSPTTRGFVGQHEDTTGLTYLNNRYHDPVLGVFTSVDPLVTNTHQPYTYSAANPVTFSDPDGLDPDTSAWVRGRVEAGGGCTYSSGLGCFEDRAGVGSHSHTKANGNARRNARAAFAAASLGYGPSSGALVPAHPCGRTGCYTAGPTPASGWQLPAESYHLSDSLPLIGETLHGNCQPQSCDVVVIVSFLGGDVVGGGTVHFEGWSPETQAFLFLQGGAVTAEPSQAFFFRRNSTATSDDRLMLVSAAQGGALPSVLNLPAADLAFPSYSVYFAYNNGPEAVGWDGALGVQTWDGIPARYLVAK